MNRLTHCVGVMLGLPLICFLSLPLTHICLGQGEPDTGRAPKVTRTDGRFVAYDNQTVLDTKTKLMWAAKDNGRALSWPDARSFVRNYRVGGYTDWRLPTLDELKGLYDAAKTYRSTCAEPIGENGQPVQDAGAVHLTELISLTCIRLWTSQGRSGYPGSVIMFDFHYGNDTLRPGFQDFVDTAGRVLPVRPGRYTFAHN